MNTIDAVNEFSRLLALPTGRACCPSHLWTNGSTPAWITLAHTHMFSVTVRVRARAPVVSKALEVPCSQPMLHLAFLPLHRLVPGIAGFSIPLSPSLICVDNHNPFLFLVVAESGCAIAGCVSLLFSALLAFFTLQELGKRQRSGLFAKWLRRISICTKSDLAHTSACIRRRNILTECLALLH